MSWKNEVQTAGDGAHWSTNAVRFETEEEARVYGLDLASRWTAVTAIKQSESSDPVNYKLANGELTRLLDA